MLRSEEKRGSAHREDPLNMCRIKVCVCVLCVFCAGRTDELISLIKKRSNFLCWKYLKFTHKVDNLNLVICEGGLVRLSLRFESTLRITKSWKEPEKLSESYRSVNTARCATGEALWRHTYVFAVCCFVYFSSSSSSLKLPPSPVTPRWWNMKVCTGNSEMCEKYCWWTLMEINLLLWLYSECLYFYKTGSQCLTIKIHYYYNNNNILIIILKWIC